MRQETNYPLQLFIQIIIHLTDAFTPTFTVMSCVSISHDHIHRTNELSGEEGRADAA